MCVLLGMDDPKPPSLAQRLQSIGVKKSHAYMIAWGKRAPSVPLACRIHRELGVKLGPVATLTDKEIAVLAKATAEEAA
jgi:hypothetical protein